MTKNKKKKKEKNDNIKNMAYKFRIFPTKEQEEYLIKSQKACLTFYNIGLVIVTSQRELSKKINKLHNIFSFTSNPFSFLLNNYIFINIKSERFNAPEIRKKVTKIAKTYKDGCLQGVYSQHLNNMIYGNEGNLDIAFKKFFKKEGGYPKFKKKYEYKDISLYIPESAIGFNIKDKENYIVIPIALGVKIDKEIKINIHRPIIGKIKHTRISSSTTGKFFISFSVEQEVEKKENLKENKAVGLDFGIKHLATLSTGEKINNNKYYAKSEKKLKKLNKKLDRKAFKKCSNDKCNFFIIYREKSKHKLRNCPKCNSSLEISKNWFKARNQVSLHDERVKNQRSDFNHKASKVLVENNNLVVLENLSMKNMSQNKKLSKALLDVGWGNFVRMLEYKGKWNNCRIEKIDRFFASSKICHHCGYKNKELTLDQRTWTCPQCKAELDRDINAAINILFKYLTDVYITGILTQNVVNLGYYLTYLNSSGLVIHKNTIGMALPEFKPVEMKFDVCSVGIKLGESDFIRQQPRKQELVLVREQQFFENST